MSRLDFFTSRKEQNRFWWFRKNNYLPPVYADLTGKQFSLLTKWFLASQQANMIGECNIPVISTMLGFIYGSKLDTIVQLGHYAGYSTLLFGWALQRMGGGQLISIDRNPHATDFTRIWIEEAGLKDVCTAITGDSAGAIPFNFVKTHMGRPKMVFVDSAHTYDQTVKELDLWYPFVQPGGLIFLHDVSEYARRFDRGTGRGVHDALLDWASMNRPTYIMLNREHYDPLILEDGCGLGIIQRGNDPEL